MILQNTRLRPLILCIRHRQGGFWEKPRIYEPGDGIRSKMDLEEEAICAKTGKWPEEDPLKWTMFGTRQYTRDELFYYSDRKGGKGYRDFADQHYEGRFRILAPVRLFNRWILVPVAAMLIVFAVDFDWFFHNGRMVYLRYIKSEAAELGRREGNGEAGEKKEGGCTVDEINCSIVDSPILSKRQKPIGFRERRIIHEGRRALEKLIGVSLFPINYEDGSFDVFMTPQDFVRSLTPGVMQPRKYGLDKYKVYNANEVKLQFSDRDSVFYWMSDSGGLITFGDYLFLMTLLSTSPSEFRLAFHVFDLNGDGELDEKEFARVQELVLSQSNVGQRHRDHITGTGAFTKASNRRSAIAKHFFGSAGDRKLNIDTFLQFQQDLHHDILKIEFERRDPEEGQEGVISEVSFAELLMIHSDLSEKRQKKMLKRVRKRYGKDVPEKKGISFAEVSAFFAFIYHIDRVDLALHFYKLAGKPLSKQLLQRVARKVTDVELSDTLVDVVVTLFDENGDGELSQREFVAIMKKRLQRGLERPKDTGLFRLADACWTCTKGQIQAFFGGTSADRGK